MHAFLILFRQTNLKTAMSNPHGRQKTMRNSTGATKPNPQLAWTLLVLMMLVFIGVMSWLSFTRHDLFNSTGFDLAINEQIVWNTLNGRFFASSVEVDNSFADHFRPLLGALVPFYALFQTPKTLLVLQTIALASAAMPIYLLAQHKLHDRWMALTFAAVYLLYPALGYITRFDFHIEVFAIAPFIAAFYMLETGRWTAASWFLLIPLLTKENMGFLAAAFGVYAIIRFGKYKWGSAWLIAGLLFTFLTIFWLIPTVRGESADAISRYAWLGENPAAMLQNLLFDPALWFKHVFTQANLIYAVQLLLPLAFLPLVGWRELLLATPILGMNLLADHFCQSTIYCHYAVPILPFVFIAAIMGFTRLRDQLATSQPAALSYGTMGALMLGSLISLWLWQPFQEVPILPSAFEPVGNAEVVKQALQAVPADGSLSLVTTNDYAPHLAQREELYIIGIPTQRVAPIDPDLVFLNLYDQQYIVCDQFRDYVTQLDKESYGVLFRTGGLIVMQKGGGSPEQFIDFVDNWNNCAG